MSATRETPLKTTPRPPDWLRDGRLAALARDKAAHNPHADLRGPVDHQADGQRECNQAR